MVASLAVQLLLELRHLLAVLSCGALGTGCNASKCVYLLEELGHQLVVLAQCCLGFKSEIP